VRNNEWDMLGSFQDASWTRVGECVFGKNSL